MFLNDLTGPAPWSAPVLRLLSCLSRHFAINPIFSVLRALVSLCMRAKRKCNFLAVSFSLFTLLLSGHATGLTFDLIDLGILPGGMSSIATSINSRGEIVGNCTYYNNKVAFRKTRAFHWSQAAGVRDLGVLDPGDYSSTATGISDNGHIVGTSSYLHHIDYSWVGQTPVFIEKAYIVQPQGGMNHIPYAESGTVRQTATGVNSSGHVIGAASVPFDPGAASWPSFKRGYLWNGVSVVDLTSSDAVYCTPLAISNAGYIAGYERLSTSGVTANRPFIWRNGQMTDIGHFSPTVRVSEVHDVNDFGNATGYSCTTTDGRYVDRYHPFLWKHDTGMLDIGGLPFGSYPDASATSLNNNDWLVGQWMGDGYAFLWTPELGYQLLSSMLAPEASGWTIVRVAGINNSGQICGLGRNPAISGDRAILLSPQCLLKTPANMVLSQPATPVWAPPPVDNDKLVFITHGNTVTAEWGNPDAHSWVGGMAGEIRNHAGLDTSWSVRGHYWDSNTILSLGVCHLARQEGERIGRALLDEKCWKKIHFIAHSAGCQLVERACSVIKKEAPGTQIHITFLDPFMAHVVDFQTNLSDWSDNYFSQDPETSAETEGAMSKAHNVDVTWLDPSATPIGSTHGWPINFFRRSITEPGFPGSQGYGFPVSMEAGGFDPSKAVGNSPVVLGTKPPSTSEEFRNWLREGFGDPVDFDNILPGNRASSTSGNVSILGQEIRLEAIGPQIAPREDPTRPVDEPVPAPPMIQPVWCACIVSVTTPPDILRVVVEFLSPKESEGLLTVYMEGTQVGMIDQRCSPSGISTHILSLPESIAAGEHSVGLRLDTFGPVEASVRVASVEFGTVGTITALDAPKVAGIRVTPSPTGQTVSIGLNGDPKKLYSLQRSNDLGGWTTIVENIFAAPSAVWADAPGSVIEDKAFFRFMQRE